MRIAVISDIHGNWHGLEAVLADITEFEKLEGCVTCLSVLLPGR